MSLSNPFSSIETYLQIYEKVESSCKVSATENAVFALPNRRRTSFAVRANKANIKLAKVLETLNLLFDAEVFTFCGITENGSMLSVAYKNCQ